MTSTQHHPGHDNARGPQRFTQEQEAPPSRSFGRALLAVLVLLGLLVGVPVLLWLLAGPPPVPTGLPDRQDLAQPLGSDLIVTVLLAVVWLAWLQFAVCTVVEIVSFVRGGGLPRAIPLSGHSQAAARALVGTALVGMSFLASSGAASAVTASDHTPTSPGATHAMTTTTDTTAEQTGPQQTGPDQRTGPSQQDGLTDQEKPAEAERSMVPVPGVPSDMTDVIGHKVAIVQAPEGHYHDNLWDIAERHLGDGRRWKEIFDLNQGRVQPDGQQLILGRLIQPGWVLVMPNDAVGLDRVTEAPKTQGTGQGQVENSSHATGGWLETAQSAADVAPIAHTSTESPLARDLTEGGLMGAAMLTALLLERRRRRGLQVSGEEAETEVALRIGADLERATWLDASLRSLSAGCRTNGLALPPVYAAAVSDDRIELRITGSHHQAPEGWRVEDDGRVWVRDRSQSLPAERGHAPYPGLVCLGRDDEGRDVLVDLESADGIVSVQGSPAVAREVVAAMAVQLATAPWADEQKVLGHDLGEDLVRIGRGTLELLPDLAPALDGLARNSVQQPAGAVLSGRLGRSPGSTPHYLVLGSVPGDGVAETLGALTREGSRGLGVVVAGSPEASRWQATVTDAGRLSLPVLGVDVDAVRLGPDSADDLARIFERATHDEPAPATGRPGVPHLPAGAGDDAHWSTARVRIGILGALEVRTSGDIDESRLPLALELATFLALQDEPVHPSVVGASIWPMGVTADVRDATVARVRDWLGTDSAGNHLLGETDTGRLHLSAEVAVDWHAFCMLVRRSRDAVPRDEAELLRRALQLVRGPLLRGVPPRRYAWMARTGIERQASILVEDAAHRLTELSPEDPSGATAAARAGLRLVPHSQVLWRDLLAAEGRQDPAALATAAEHMLTQLHSAGVPLEPESAALLDELLPAQGGRLA